jgi:hypothetical protein
MNSSEEEKQFVEIQESVQKVFQPCVVSNKDRGSDYYEDNSYYLNQYSNNVRSS